MKKYTQSPEYLLYMQKRARREAAARLRFSNYRRDRNRRINHLSKPLRKGEGIRQKAINEGYAEIDAPQILSFVRNPEEVSAFLLALRQLENKKRPIFVKLRDVKEIDYDAITVLLSAVIRFKSRKILFNGDYPRDENVRDTIIGSGFFEYINDRFKEEDQYALEGRKIFTHAKKNVDPELGQKIIENASTVVWGSPRRCRGVQRALIELMQNTNNHASPDNAGEKHWWLCVKHIREERRVVFSFIDYGVGVFNSLKNKRPDNKFYGVLDELMKMVRPQETRYECSILKMIFEGQLHKTVTGKTYRGKGLPGVYQAFQRKQISNLSMITNNVVFNSNGMEYVPLLTEFEGTFISWELNEHNHNLAQ